MDTTFGDIFREIRKSRNISQERLSRESGVSRSTIIRLEGGGDIKKDKLDRLLGSMGCSLGIDGDGGVRYLEHGGIGVRIEINGGVNLSINKK